MKFLSWIPVASWCSASFCSVLFCTGRFVIVSLKPPEHRWGIQMETISSIRNNIKKLRNEAYTLDTIWKLWRILCTSHKPLHVPIHHLKWGETIFVHGTEKEFTSVFKHVLSFRICCHNIFTSQIFNNTFRHWDSCLKYVLSNPILCALVPLNLNCLHCLQHSFFEHLFNIYYSSLISWYEPFNIYLPKIINVSVVQKLLSQAGKTKICMTFN